MTENTLPDWLDGPFSAYVHNGDRDLMWSLGLRTNGFRRERTDLGTIVVQEEEEQTYGNPPVTQVRPAATVKVEVTALPAQFWRFTVTRPREEIEELGQDADGRSLWRTTCEPERFVIETGSGGFSDYWPAVKLVAENMFEVTRVEINESPDASDGAC